jgi:hypothetical protein
VLGLHRWWSWATVAAQLAVALWATAADRLPRLRARALWVATAVAQVAVVVACVLGALVQQVDDREPPGLHVLYGALAIATVGILYSYRSQLAHRVHLLYGVGGLWLAGLLLRGALL